MHHPNLQTMLFRSALGFHLPTVFYPLLDHVFYIPTFPLEALLGAFQHGPHCRAARGHRYASHSALDACMELRDALGVALVDYGLQMPPEEEVGRG